MNLIPNQPAEINFTIHRGVDYSIPLQFKESADGDPIDLTGYTFSCETLDEEDASTPLQSPTVTVTDAADGSIAIEIPRATTEDTAVMPTDHYWRLWWTDGSGDRQLKISGRIRMEWL